MELYEAVKKLDLRQVVCPTTSTLTQNALAAIEKGDIVQIRLNPGEQMDNVPEVVLHAGHKIMDILKDGNSYILYVMKH